MEFVSNSNEKEDCQEAAGSGERRVEAASLSKPEILSYLYPAAFGWLANILSSP